MTPAEIPEPEDNQETEENRPAVPGGFPIPLGDDAQLDVAGLAALAARVEAKYLQSGAVVAVFVESDGDTQCAIQIGGYEVAFTRASTPIEAIRAAEIEVANST